MDQFLVHGDLVWPCHGLWGVSNSRVLRGLIMVTHEFVVNFNASQNQANTR
jgi:hypothetical protein